MRFGVLAIFDSFKQFGVPACAHFGITKFAHQSILDSAAQLRGHGLHTVANAQHRHTEFKHDLRRTRGIGVGDRRMRTRQNHALWVEGTNVGIRHIVRMQLRIHAGLAHASGDQLGDLRTKIENEYFVLHASARNGLGGRFVVWVHGCAMFFEEPPGEESAERGKCRRQIKRCANAPVARRIV